LFGVTRDAATDSAIKTALKNAGKNLASSLVSGFTAVKDFLSKTWSAIDWMATFDLASAQSAVTKFCAGLGDFFVNDLQNLPAFFDAAVDAVDNMVSGLVSALPTIKKNIGIIIKKIVSYLKGDGFKELLKLVIYLIVSIAEAILENLGDIVDAVLEVIPEIIIALADALPEIVSAIVRAIPQIVVAVVKAIPAIIYALGVAFVDLCKAIFSLAVGAGDYIWKGIVAGFEAAGNWLYTYIISPIEGAFSAMCDWIGGIFGKIGDAIGSILKAPINGIIAAINWIIDQINKIRIDIDWLNIHVGFSLGHIDYLAKGTDNWKGGEAIVGEKGPELVDLPAGSVVHPATETASLLSGMSALRSGFMPSLAFASSGSGNSSMSVNVSPTTVQIDGRTVGRIVYEQIDRLAANS
jgi:phage-related protein